MTANPSSISLLVNVAGGVCLLLWGSFTVRDGVRQAFSARLSQLLSRSSSISFSGVMSGALVAILTQSATATILLTVTLVESGLVGMAAAMAVVLGADLGSSLAARILYIDMSLLAPSMMILGLALHLMARAWRLKCLGRILVGLGLMLLAIIWIRASIEPFVHTPIPADWLSVLQSASWLGVVLIALLTWFGHSSVAAVLVIATLDQGGVLPLEITLPMLLGANIGAALITLPMVATAATPARAVVIANLVFKSVLAVVLFVALPWLVGSGKLDFILVNQPAGPRIILLHIGFNLLVLCLWLVPSGWVASHIKNWLDRRQGTMEGLAGDVIGAGLDPRLISQPQDALAIAKREAFRLGDAAEALFSRTLAMFEASDHSEVHRLVSLDKEINARNKAIHRYLSAVRQHVSNPQQEQALDRILQFSSTMEDIGDAVSHDLARLAIKRLDRGVNFSGDGQAEIAEIHQQLMTLIRDEINDFADSSTDRSEELRGLMKEIQTLCQQSISQHRQRLSSSQSRSVATSSIHQDMVRDLLQIAMLFQRQVD